MSSIRVGFNWGLDGYSISNGQFRYAVELFRSLDALPEDAEFHVFGTRDRPPAEIEDLFSGREVRWRWYQRPSWRGRVQYVVNQALDAATFRRVKLDVLHCIDSSIPWLPPCPLLWTLYDLAPEVMPEERGWRESKAWRRYRRDVRRIDRHLAISHATASDAVRIWGLDPARITVAQLGTSFPPPGLADHPAGALLDGVLAPRGKPFLCAAYNLYPRKNIDALVAAMRHLRGEFPDLQVVLFGRTGISPEREAWFEAELARGGLRDAVIRVGFVDDLVLADLYRSAAAFVFPSLYEGFGLPLVEAMAVGACVIARNCSSMAEVVGDGGLLLEAKDGRTLADGIARILRDPQERERLARQGVARASTFTLRRLARQTFDAYRRTAARR